MYTDSRSLGTRRASLGGESKLQNSKKGTTTDLIMNLPAHIAFPAATEEQARRTIDVLPALQALAKPQSPRVAIKAKGKIVFINLDEVHAVHAEGNYVSLQRNENSYLLRESISVMAERLEPYGFIRIHRSVLVNTSFVEEIKPYSTGEYGLLVKGGKEYTVTRAHRKNLKCLAEFWIGTGAFFSE